MFWGFGKGGVYVGRVFRESFLVEIVLIWCCKKGWVSLGREGGG